ncbi:MAG: hypothetical protein ACLFOA_03315 [Desulfohalobiaceae bacterium]
MKNNDTLRSEYPAELIKSGQRGKYAKRYQEEGTNLVFIEPDLLELYPDSEAVNRALRQYTQEHGHRESQKS